MGVRLIGCAEEDHTARRGPQQYLPKVRSQGLRLVLHVRCVCKKEVTPIALDGDDDVAVIKAAEHPSHLPAPEEATAIQAYNRIKRRADDHPEATPAQILRAELPEVGLRGRRTVQAVCCSTI